MNKRKCRNKACGEFFRPKVTEIWVKEFWCSPECREAIALAALARNKENRVKAKERAEKRVKTANKKAVKDLLKHNHKYQFDLTKKTAQALANRIDHEKPCICCGTMRGAVQFCGGHCKTAGGNPELALDLRNIHGQVNRLCNMEKSGNIAGDKHSYGYREGLRLRYGQKMLDYLDGPHPTVKRTCEELIELRAVYAKEIRYIEEHGAPSRDWRSLDKLGE